MGQTPSNDEQQNASQKLGSESKDSKLGQSAPINMKPREAEGKATSPRGLSDSVRAALFDPGQDGEQQGKRPAPPQVPQIETVPTAFRWTHGGERVFVTGSFNNWQGKITMPRSEDGKEFVLVIDIPPGVHQYKYIVDEAWRLDPDQPTCINQGVVNNVIEVKRSVFEDNRAEWGNALVESDDELDENKQKISYGQRQPSAEDYVKDPLKVPPQFNQILLNSPQVSVDPLVLPIPQSHVTLNHLYVYGGANTDANVLVTGITQRFKLKAFASLHPKFVTTVYYSPKVAGAT